MVKDVPENRNAEKLMTTKQVAEMLQVEIRMLENWRSERKGPPFVKVGVFVRYRIAAIETWLKQQQVSTEAKLV